LGGSDGRDRLGYVMIFYMRGSFMPGCHVTDQQMRLFMTLRQTQTVSVAAAKGALRDFGGHQPSNGVSAASRPNIAITEEDAARSAPS
jgi:hypothetical protein